MEDSLTTVGRRVNQAFTKFEGYLDSSLGLLHEESDNESQRFQLWAVNLGLYQSGHSSLDYRFRDAPSLYEFARKLLLDLERYLGIGQIKSAINDFHSFSCIHASPRFFI